MKINMIVYNYVNICNLPATTFSFCSCKVERLSQVSSLLSCKASRRRTTACKAEAAKSHSLSWSAINSSSSSTVSIVAAKESR